MVAAAGAGTDQISGTAMILGTYATVITSLATDYAQIFTYLCSQYGTCCSSTLCNGSVKNILNSFALLILFSSILMVIISWVFYLFGYILDIYFY